MTAVTLEMSLAALASWRQSPISFIETVLVNPETQRPFELLPAERAFLAHAFQLDHNGKLKYPEQVYSCPKKSGKTTFAALHVLTLTLLYGGAYPEATLCANDQEQARGRVFEMVRRIVEASPVLKREARLTESRITFPAFNATVTAIASDAGSAAGGNQSISVFDELWAYTSERSRRLWDEMVPPPTRKIACRLTVTYAGFSGESLLLEELHKRGKALPEVAPNLHAADGLLMFWSHTPVAPWQDEAWLTSMRNTLRPSAYARMVLNEFATSESAFVDLSAWDACVLPTLTPVREDRRTHVWAGVDASVKRDSTALVAVSCDRKTKVVRLITHRVFTPTTGYPIDFEATIEATVLEWREKFLLRRLLYDPFQMAAVAQRLQRAGVRMEEFPQTVPNLTAATSNLFDLIHSRSLMVYPTPDLRLAMSRAVMHESSRGWRLDKLKQQHKIDSVVALSMACLAAIRGVGEYAYDTTLNWVSGPDEPDADAGAGAAREFQQAR
jgi:phage terminase large subunit-like protein